MRARSGRRSIPALQLVLILATGGGCGGGEHAVRDETRVHVRVDDDQGTSTRSDQGGTDSARMDVRLTPAAETSSTPTAVALTSPSFPEAARIVDLALNDDERYCAILEDGAVWCWRARERRFEPEHINLSDPAIQIYGEVNSFCAVNESGRVSCWGRVGLDREDWRTPRLLAIPRPSEMAFGPQGGCALVEDRSVRCWGTAWQGHARTLESIETRPGLERIQAIDAAGLSRCALEANHRVSCWGWHHYDHLGRSNDDGYLRHPEVTNARDIALSQHHLWWVTPEGRVRVMVRGRHDDRRGIYRYDVVDVRGVQDVVSIESDELSVCAITRTGALWCWIPDEREPRVAPFGGVTRLRTNSTGTTCAQTASSWFCRRREEDWQELTFGSTPSTARASAQPMTEAGAASCGVGPDHVAVLELSAGYAHFCARLADGNVRCWGLNQAGQVGGALSADPISSRGIPLAGNARSVATGLHYSCALTDDGTMWCWGQGDRGQLARGDRRDSGSPVQIGIPGRVAGMALGWMHACAIDHRGRLHCWGANEHGQLGDGTHELRTTPVQVRGISDVRLAAAGPDSTCALSGARVLCWGGARGVGTPEAVPGIDGSRVRGLVAARNASCALHADGSVWCWGSGAEGQLGPAEPIESRTALRIEGLPLAVRLAAYETEICATTAEGAIWCWGRPSASRRPRRAPSPPRPESLPHIVEAIHEVADVAPGYHAICAAQRAGGVCCWEQDESPHPLDW